MSPCQLTPWWLKPAVFLGNVKDNTFSFFFREREAVAYCAHAWKAKIILLFASSPAQTANRPYTNATGLFPFSCQAYGKHSILTDPQLCNLDVCSFNLASKRPVRNVCQCRNSTRSLTASSDLMPILCDKNGHKCVGGATVCSAPIMLTSVSKYGISCDATMPLPILISSQWLTFSQLGFRLSHHTDETLIANLPTDCLRLHGLCNHATIKPQTRRMTEGWVEICRIHWLPCYSALQRESQCIYLQ